MRLLDADAANPVGCRRKGHAAHAARPHTAVPGLPARRPLMVGVAACAAGVSITFPECFPSYRAASAALCRRVRSREPITSGVVAPT